MITEAQNRLSVLAVCAVTVWIASLAMTIWPIVGASLIVLLALTLIAIALLIRIWGGHNRYFLLSPLFCLALLTLLFYGLLPTLYATFEVSIQSALQIKIFPRAHARTLLYVGSDGERLILQFSAMCLALTALSLDLIPTRNSRHDDAPEIARIIPISIGAVSILLSIGALLVVRRVVPTAETFFSSSFGQQLGHALMPVFSLALVTFGYIAAAQNLRFRLIVLIFSSFILAIVILAKGLAFTPVFVAISALMIFAVVGNVQRRHLALVANLAVGVVLVSIVATALVREHMTRQTSTEIVWQALFAKLVLRQGVSGDCLDRVIQRHQGAEGGGPFYFVSAVVPRAFWPEKPILSRGDVFAEKYCDQVDAVKGRHSESFTLLGEPLLEAGIPGLIVAQLFIGIVLVAATAVGLTGKPLPMIAMTAMLPWLATFQPGFAEYFGNMVKTFLFMSPFVALLGWNLRQGR